MDVVQQPKLADEIVDSRQEWRTSLDAYVRHFTSSLELEYEAERQAVLEKVQKRSTRQLQVRFLYVFFLIRMAGYAHDYYIIGILYML